MPWEMVDNKVQAEKASAEPAADSKSIRKSQGQVGCCLLLGSAVVEDFLVARVRLRNVQ